MSKSGLWVSPTEYREFAALTPRLQEVATRRMAEWVSGARLLPNPDQVLRKMGLSSVATYRELLTDDRVGPGVEILKAGIRSLDWELRQEDSEDRVFAFVQDNFKALKKAGKIQRIIGATVNAYLYGMQPFERTWRADGSRNWLMDLVAKPPEWFRYGVDGELRFLQRGIPDGIRVDDEAHRYQFQVARHDDDYLNPYGFAVLSRCFWPVAFKKGGIKFWATAVEKWGMPHAIGKVPPGTPEDKVEEMLAQLEGLVRDAVAVIWDNSKVEILEAKGSTSSGSAGGIHLQLVKWADNAITTSLLGHQGAAQSTPGKLGGEDMAAVMRDELVWALKNMAAEQMNVAIADLVEMNFGPGVEAPAWAFYEAEDVDTTRSERDAKLVPALKASKLRLARKYWQDKYNLSDEDLEETGEGEEDEPTDPEPGRFTAPRRKAAAARRDRKAIASQEALQALLEGVSPELAQHFAASALGPVIEFARSAGSIEEIRDGLPELFPQMDVKELHETLTRLAFIAELYGRAAAGAA